MDVQGLWSLQCMMFLLMAAGAILKKTGILKEEGKAVLTDVVIYFLLPCNIINSFRMEFEPGILKKFAVILTIAVLTQMVCYSLSKILYNRKPADVKRVMQYGTLVSNSGFLGLPLAEGIYGAEGMMYAAIFTIPMRIMMWSAGIACFTESPDMKTVIKKVALHPCIVAVYIGLGMLVFQTPLNYVYQELLSVSGPFGTGMDVVVTALDKGIRSAGGATTALTMILIGMMVAEVHPSHILDKDVLFLTVLRLILLPGAVFLGCHLAGINGFLAGVAVLMTGMPVGSTSAILAAKYGCDYTFATKCVVVSTLLSVVSIPVWGMVLG